MIASRLPRIARGGSGKSLDRAGLRYLALMTAILLCAFSFGANGLETDIFWADEVYSVGNMGGFDPPRGPVEIVESVVSVFPDHVPLFFLLGAAWAHIVGWTQFALRLLPVLAGIVLIAFTFRLGSDMFNRRTGALAAALLSTSAYIILYIHDFRMYSLLLLLATLHLWLYWRMLRGRRADGTGWLAFILSAAALLYTHLFALIFFAGLAVYHLTVADRSRRWRQIALAWLTGAALFMPYSPVLIAGIRRATTLNTVTEAAATPAELLPLFLRLLSNGSWAVAALIVAIVVVAFWRRRASRIKRLLLMCLAMLCLILLANALIGLIPTNRMRYFLILFPAALPLIAFSVTQLPRPGVMSALLLCAWIVSGYQFYRSEEIRLYVGGMDKTWQNPPLNEWAYHLLGKTRAQDYLLGFTGMHYVNVDLTLGQSSADMYTHIYLGIDGGFLHKDAWGEWMRGDIRQIMTYRPYYIFLYEADDLPRTYETVKSTLEEAHVVCDILLDMPDLAAQRWVDRLAGCDHEYLPVAFENGIQLVDRFGSHFPDEAVARLVTGWELADESQLHEYNISLQVFAPDWNKLWQNDWHLSSDVVKWHQVEISTAAFPPGEYRVLLILYDRATGSKVAGKDLNSGVDDVFTPLLSFKVEA